MGISSRACAEVRKPGVQDSATPVIDPAPVVNLPGGRQEARLQGIHERLPEARHQLHKLILAALLHSCSHHLAGDAAGSESGSRRPLFSMDRWGHPPLRLSLRLVPLSLAFMSL